MKLPKGFKTAEEYTFPNIVNICVFKGSCPCECKHCPIGSTPKTERNKKFGKASMNLDTFKRIVDEIAMFNHSTLRIHSVGEPFLWKNLEKAITYAKSKNIKIWLFTSLVTDNKILLDCIANNCTIIEVSVNSIDKDNYKNTKGIENFDSISRNIKYIANFIQKNNLKTRLITSRVESMDKEYDTKFVDYWENSGFVADSFIRSYHNYNNVIEGRESDKIRKPVPCLVHWTRFNIDCDGKVIVCFNELFKGPKVDKDLVLGDVNKQSIQSIWQGEKLNIIRKAQLEGNYNIADFTKKLCCLNCKYCQPFDTKRQTSEHQIKQWVKNGN